MTAHIETDIRPSDRFIPWYFVAFFVVVFIANGIFIYFALESQPGVIEEHNYEIGLAYDDRIAEDVAEQALGWVGDVMFDNGVLTFTLSDREGSPLRGADARAVLVRPVQAGHDFPLSLTQEEPGVYRAPAVFPLPGRWDAYIYVTWNDQPYHIMKTLLVTP